MKRILCILLAFLLCLPMAVQAATFPDVSDGADYAGAVEYLNEIGVMMGDEKGNFNPDRPVTRAEMAAIICRLVGEENNLPSRTDFPDVPLGHWASGYVSKVAELGIVNGYSTGFFGPTDTVTYEQTLTMLVRAMGAENDAISAGGYPNGYISVANEYGYGSAIPAQIGEELSRWQVAAIIYGGAM